MRSAQEIGNKLRNVRGDLVRKLARGKPIAFIGGSADPIRRSGCDTKDPRTALVLRTLVVIRGQLWSATSSAASCFVQLFSQFFMAFKRFDTVGGSSGGSGGRSGGGSGDGGGGLESNPENQPKTTQLQWWWWFAGGGGDGGGLHTCILND